MPDWLSVQTAGGGEVIPLASSAWRLQIPAGAAGAYRLAQLSDTHGFKRSSYRWQPPVTFELEARASALTLPGTWGFGFWNEPFGATLPGMNSQRLPTLPNTAWYFFASPPNWLSLRDDLPANGFLAATFYSPVISPLLLALGLPSLALLPFPAGRRTLRKLARRAVKQATSLLAVAAQDWHHYRLEWRQESTRFLVDGELILDTPISPHSRLGCVIWIDNQYAAFTPEGHLSSGTLPNPDPAWIEIRGLAGSASLDKPSTHR